MLKEHPILWTYLSRPVSLVCLRAGSTLHSNAAFSCVFVVCTVSRLNVPPGRVPLWATGRLPVTAWWRVSNHEEDQPKWQTERVGGPWSGHVSAVLKLWLCPEPFSIFILWHILWSVLIHLVSITRILYAQENIRIWLSLQTAEAVFHWSASTISQSVHHLESFLTNKEYSIPSCSCAFPGYFYYCVTKEVNPCQKPEFCLCFLSLYL